VKTKSTYPNSKPDIDSEIHSNFNIRQLYGKNSRKINKNNNILKNNRHPRSKSQIINDRRKNSKYNPKGIKTVLIKFNKPIDQNCNEKEKSNINNNFSNDIKYKTYFTEKFYNKNNKDKLDAQKLLINNKENIINVDLSFENLNNNSNVISFYLPYQEKKNTRNKSVILQNEYFSNTNNSINSSFNSIYKKSFCVDKHKNYGGNFKNKEREKSSSKIIANKSFNNIKYNKKVITKNISSPNMQNIINISEIHENLGKIGNINLLNQVNKKIFQYNNKNNNCNKSTSNEIKKINIKYDLQNGKSKMKINTNNITKNDEDANLLIKNNLEEFQDKLKQNKIKRKNIPPLNFNNNIKKKSNINNYNENINSNLQNFYNQKYINNRINTSQFGSIKNKENILTFEEPINDAFSMKNNIKNKGNLFNLINISEQVSKRDNIDQIYKNSEVDTVSNYMHKKENNKTKLVKRNNNKNNSNNISYDNNININNNNNIVQKANIQKNKIKTKGKEFRTNSAKNIDAKGYQIKSIPLKLGSNKNTKYINGFNNITNNIQNFQNKNNIISNVVFINKKDFSLWNDLTRIYDNNGKFQ
jgi:hypothetical protein